MIGLKAERGVIMVDGFVDATAHGERLSEVVVSDVVVFCYRGGMAKEGLTVLPVPHLQHGNGGVSKDQDSGGGRNRETWPLKAAGDIANAPYRGEENAY